MAHHLKAYGFVFLLLTMMSTAVHAASSQTFDDVIDVNGTQFQLQGVGHKKFLFAKAFTAGFYMCDRHPSNSPLDTSTPKHLEVEYFVNIPSQKLTKFTVSRMQAAVDEQKMNSLRAELELMSNYFVDLKSGDRFALTYLPEQGTVFSHNGEVTGVIPGEQFAQAIFSVWVGDKPFDDRLKQDMLGRNESRPSLSHSG
jgi:hypothetical protein